jgi:hypothetical protein
VDLRAARAQCAETEETGRAAAAKVKVAEGELVRLRRLEENHLKELALLRTAEKEKVDDLSKRLTEVEKQRLALQEEVTAKSAELSATAKRWVEEIGTLDRGLSGECFFLSSFPFAGFRLSAAGLGWQPAAETLIFSLSPSSGWGQSARAGCRQAFPSKSPSSGWGQSARVGCRQAYFRASESPSTGWGQSAHADCRQPYFRTPKICILQLIFRLR